MGILGRNYKDKAIEYHKKYNIENKEKLKNKRMENKYKRYEKWKQWIKTENGKEYVNKKMAKRRNKKWIPIFPNIFPKEIPVDYHHVDGRW